MTLLGRTVRRLAEMSSPTALIGGVALAVHGITRHTEDADLLSTDGRVLSDAFWEILRNEGTKVEVRRGDFDDPLRGVVRLTAEGEKTVDVVVGRSAWHEQALSRRRVLHVAGEDLPVVDPADLVLLKLEAGGPQDLLDIRLLLAGPEGNAIRADVEARLPSLPSSLQATWVALPSP
ncbi:MAG TPA: nucleotidyl transferase AbiEii/AbiGii toxin family protein [Thermoanaerobaculia bacterium]|nr:nucleotidyl transferase AbiEii/AbiGii toxin family protein [Thermoanaerobaculia bacterium]